MSCAEQLHWLASSPCLAYSVQDTGSVIGYCNLGKNPRHVQLLRAHGALVEKMFGGEAGTLHGARAHSVLVDIVY